MASPSSSNRAAAHESNQQEEQLLSHYSQSPDQSTQPCSSITPQRFLNRYKIPFNELVDAPQPSRRSVYTTVPSTPNTPALSEIDDSERKAAKGIFRLPTLSRFLADFTLGFADGLTVPFALTAGLSSLGHTETVIYAGSAEICAGSISMGIGGYLAAKGEIAASKRSSVSQSYNDEEDEEKAASARNNDIMEDYLAPLGLPEDLFVAVRTHVQARPSVFGALSSDDDDGGFGERSFSPVMVGLSVSLGYLLGGLLPLFPYFLVSHVGDGMWWSFLVCILALFAFGFTKDYLLQEGDNKDDWLQPKDKRSAMRWRRIKKSLWEGTQMVILGSIAAIAAVLCVRLFEDFQS